MNLKGGNAHQQGVKPSGRRPSVSGPVWLYRPHSQEASPDLNLHLKKKSIYVTLTALCLYGRH